MLTRLNLNDDTALKALYVIDVNTNAVSGSTIAIDGFAQSASLSVGIANTPYTSLKITNSATLTALDVIDNTQLTELVVSGNPGVTALDVSTLTSLTSLDVNACGLTALNVDTNVALVNLDCSGNSLSTLRITNNTDLETVNVSNNNLFTINVRQNTALKSLDVSGNINITNAITLGNNTALETFNASNTGLTHIDVTSNLALKNLNLSGCGDIISLDLSANTELITLNVSSTGLLALDASNCIKIEEADIRNCSAVASLSILKTAKLIVTAGLNNAIYQVGQFVSIENEPGVVYEESNTKAKIISADESSATGYSMGSFSEGKGAGWQIPGVEEFETIFTQKDILNHTLSLIGYVQLEGEYWTPTRTQYMADNKGITYKIDDGISDQRYRTISFKVRAIRAL